MTATTSPAPIARPDATSRRRRLPRWLDGILAAVGLPLLLLSIWALSAVIAPNRYFPSPWRIGEAFALCR